MLYRILVIHSNTLPVDTRAIVQRIIFEMQRRIDRLASEPELSMALDWIKRYLNLAQKHMITMDALQETILKEVGHI